MLLSIRKAADGLIGLSAAIGSLALVVEVVLILVDVIGRAFGAPLFGSQDMITMVMVLLVFGGMALCDRDGGHISVDLIERYVPGVLNRLIDMFSALLGAVIFVFIAYAVMESAKLSVMLNLSTNLMQWPKAWFQWALCGFALVTAAGMALRFVELAISGRDIRREKETV
ncbi:MAG: TRAP transporter small permease [Pseudorhodobacter sp.]|nr:TRAP transporter small permease [Pseudorhodobacter sp.]